MTDSAEGTPSPIDTLTGLLSPENEEWFRSQSKNKQQEMADKFATWGAKSADMIPHSAEAMTPGVLANKIVQDVRNGAILS